MGVATAADFDEYLARVEPRLTIRNPDTPTSSDPQSSLLVVPTTTTELGEWVTRNIEPLTYNNYETWSSGMRSYIESKGLQLHIEEGMVLVHAMQPHKSVWVDEVKVREVIKLSCSPEILPYVIHAQYAHDAWNWLREAVNASEDEKERHKEMVATAAAARANLLGVPEVDKVLTKRNYYKWKPYMKNVMLSKYIWTVVCGTDPVDSRNYFAKNYIALTTLRMSCGKDVLEYIYDEDNAHDAWCKLEGKLKADSADVEESEDSGASTLYEIKIDHELLHFNYTTNYETWEPCVETYLIQQGLWGFLEEDEIADYVKDEKALDVIKLSCTPQTRFIIEYSACAKDAWEDLKIQAESPQLSWFFLHGAPIQRVDMGEQADIALTRGNYKEWKKYVAQLLNNRYFWGNLDLPGVTPRLPRSHDPYENANACALRIIKEACGWDMLPYIFRTESAAKAWEMLEVAASTELKDDYMKYSRLLHAIQKNGFREQMEDRNGERWRGAYNFFREFPAALSHEITEDGSTPLHVAVRLGRVDIVRELLNLMTSSQVDTFTCRKNTAISIAAGGNNIEIVDMLVDKSPTMLRSCNSQYHDPLTIAAINGNENMMRHLYKKTIEHLEGRKYMELQHIKGNEDMNIRLKKSYATLLTSAARVNAFDIVFDLFTHHNNASKYALYRDDYEKSLLSLLTGMPLAFPSGNQFGPIRGWIYQLAGIKPHGNVLKALKVIVPGLNQLIDTKIKHEQVHGILQHIYSQLPNMNPLQLEEALVYDAVHRSTVHGIIEVFEVLIDTNPYLEDFKDENGRGLFQIAIMNRQESIFQYLLQMGQRNQNMGLLDNLGNNALHCAAFWDPSSKLVHGPALQIQRELQWIQEVERVVPPRYKEMKNGEKLTPRALFSREHKDLAKEAEKWMKEMAQACIIVTALIATVMFAAPFTLPGGTDQNTGVSLTLHSRAFKVFTVSDVISLFASCTSLLMFFSILTARYAEIDFLTSLPRRLILGLFSLFISIATMMATFTSTIVIVLREDTRSRAHIWVSILACIPVLIFALLQFRLFGNLVLSTYGRGIFRSKRKVVAPLISIGYG